MSSRHSLLHCSTMSRFRADARELSAARPLTGVYREDGTNGTDGMDTVTCGFHATDARHRSLKTVTYGGSSASDSAKVSVKTITPAGDTPNTRRHAATLYAL
jgi:hypothetical protein